MVTFIQSFHVVVAMYELSPSFPLLFCLLLAFQNNLLCSHPRCYHKLDGQKWLPQNWTAFWRGSLKDLSSVEYDEELESKIESPAPIDSWSIHPQVDLSQSIAVDKDWQKLKASIIWWYELVKELTLDPITVSGKKILERNHVSRWHPLRSLCECHSIPGRNWMTKVRIPQIVSPLDK